MPNTRPPLTDSMTTSIFIGQEYTDEETDFLRKVVREQQAKKRTNLSNVELFRLIKSMGYKKDNK